MLKRMREFFGHQSCARTLKYNCAAKSFNLAAVDLEDYVPALQALSATYRVSIGWSPTGGKVVDAESVKTPKPKLISQDLLNMLNQRTKRVGLSLVMAGGIVIMSIIISSFGKPEDVSSVVLEDAPTVCPKPLVVRVISTPQGSKYYTICP
jgi:hypothetical protein